MASYEADESYMMMIPWQDINYKKRKRMYETGTI